MTTFNHVLEGVAFGGISSGAGSVTGKASKYAGKIIRWTSKLAKKKKTRKLIKRTLEAGTEYVASKMGENPASAGLKQLRDSAQSRMAAKAYICIP